MWPTWGADFFAFSAHKAMGPMGIGVLWGKMDLLNAMPPMLTGGEMMRLCHRAGRRLGARPREFEAGAGRRRHLRHGRRP